MWRAFVVSACRVTVGLGDVGSVNGDTDGFALCTHGTQNSVVFKPKAGNGYDLSTCYEVKVQLIYDF